MTFKPYSKYKDSGIEWLGMMPEKWTPARIKSITVSVKDGTHGTFARLADGIPLLSAKNVKDGELEVSQVESLISYEDYESIHRSGYLRLGDLLLTIVGTIGRLAVFTGPEPVAFQRSVCVIRFGNIQETRYYYYFLASSFIQQTLLTITNQSAQGGVYLGAVANLAALVPPLPEQRTIAAFLDRETGRIDELIAKKERQIELLQEKRQALISHAVTKGLDSKVKLKDSGIEWLGMVPEGWKVQRLKHVCSVFGRIGFRGYTTADQVSEGEGALTIGAGHITSDGKLDFTSPVYISWEKYYESPEIMIHSGDVLIVQRGSCGRIGFVDRDLGPTTINPSVVVLKRAKVNSEYLFRFLTSNYVQWYLQLLTSSTAVPMISQNQIENMPICIPPRDDLIQILVFLHQSLSKTDELTGKIRASIEKLREYRTALISAAVTGKIDLREER